MSDVTRILDRVQQGELLEAHFGGVGFLPKPAVSDPLPATLCVSPPAVAPAQMLSRYKLLEKIGEGGFGEVWMAEQREPVKRRVALKIIKLGMDSRQIVARFEAERQALAMMDHANIAKIFDAGTTEPVERRTPIRRDDGSAESTNADSEIGAPFATGRPYFVMELVRGIKITEYCDQNQLPTQERLRLFILVCQAIQHAHQKGIIHRDIKPSNILVTLHDGVPVPKVIDFGIAKATQQELTDKTVFTQFQQFIGTRWHAAASPGQGRQNDPRSHRPAHLGPAPRRCSHRHSSPAANTIRNGQAWTSRAMAHFLKKLRLPKVSLPPCPPESRFLPHVRLVNLRRAELRIPDS